MVLRRRGLRHHPQRGEAPKSAAGEEPAVDRAVRRWLM